MGCAPSANRPATEPRPISQLIYLELTLLLEAEDRNAEFWKKGLSVRAEQNFEAAVKRCEIIRNARNAAWERDKPKQ